MSETETNVAASSMNALLTDEHVVWLYRCLLGRDPETVEAVSWFREKMGSFGEGRRYLFRCDEFRLLNPNLFQKPQYYIPESHVQPYVKSFKRLGLAAIVKDEATHVENMLRSCAPLIDYAVFVDTGSSDETVSIIRSTAANLSIPVDLSFLEFENFSQVRNAALSRIPPDIDWILMLDADEEIVAADYWRFNALLEANDVDAWQLPRYNFSDRAKRKPVEPYPDFQLRLFRNRIMDPVRFVGRVHERPHNVGWRDAPTSNCEAGVLGGPHIHHLGYMEITHERWQRKHDFYTCLADTGEKSSS